MAKKVNLCMASSFINKGYEVPKAIPTVFERTDEVSVNFGTGAMLGGPAMHDAISTFYLGFSTAAAYTEGVDGPVIKFNAWLELKILTLLHNLATRHMVQTLVPKIEGCLVEISMMGGRLVSVKIHFIEIMPKCGSHGELFMLVEDEHTCRVFAWKSDGVLSLMKLFERYKVTMKARNVQDIKQNGASTQMITHFDIPNTMDHKFVTIADFDKMSVNTTNGSETAPLETHVAGSTGICKPIRRGSLSCLNLLGL